VAKEDSDNELLGLGKIISSVVSRDAESKQSSSVVKNSNKEEIKPDLTSEEESRLKKIVKILGQELKIGIYESKPEAPRLKDLTPDVKKQPPPPPSAISDKVKKPPTDNKFGWLDALGLLGGLAALAFMFKDQIKKFWDDHKDKIKEVLKGIGAEINKYWEENKEGIKQTFKDIMSGMFSALLGAIQWAWEEGSAAAKTRLIQSVVKPLIPSTPGTKAPAAVPEIPKTPTPAPEIPKPGKIDSKVIQQGVDDFSKFAKPGAGASKTSTVLEGLGKIGKSAMQGLGTAGTATKEYAKDKAAKLLGSLLPKLLTAVGGVGKLLKGVLKFPLLAETVELGLLTKSVGDERKRYDNGEITLEQLRESVGKLGLNSAGGIIGGNAGRIGGYMLGAGAGGLISTALAMGTLGIGAAAAPALVHGLGVAGSIGGAFAGDMAGRWLANLTSKALQALGPGVLQDVGDNILDLHSWLDPRYWLNNGKDIKGEEMQDFFVRGDKVYPFNNKDDLMGLKTGGAIDNVFKDLTEGISKDNSTIKDASIAQVNRLDSLIELMKAFLQKSGSQGSGNINISNGSNYTPSTTFDLRQQFNAQTLLT
jgi:hypothetical protein